MKYYRLDNLDKENATYSMAIGERSNGKTYAVLERILDNYLKSGLTNQGAIIRRWAEDIKSYRGQVMFNALLQNGKLINTIWTGIDYKSRAWWLYYDDEKLNKRIYDKTPFCYAFCLSEQEHEKSVSYPNITTVLFDEFLTRKTYLPDEFILFMNVLSTIIRERDNVKIYMLANTVSKNSPYFTEMGINHIDKLKQGTITIYKYGDSDLKVALEYCDNYKRNRKKSDKYFAFDNDKLKMITGGAWEVGVYNRLPIKYKPKDIIFIYFIKWENKIIQCEIVEKDNNLFTYCHFKTTPLKESGHDIIYSCEPSPSIYWKRNIIKDNSIISRKIMEFFSKDLVYYQNAECGETVRYYLQYCTQYNIIKS